MPSPYHTHAKNGSVDSVEMWSRTWRKPQVSVYRPADPRPRVMWNRYPSNEGEHGAHDVTIGIAAVAFRRAWSITWATPHVTKVVSA